MPESNAQLVEAKTRVVAHRMNIAAGDNQIGVIALVPDRWNDVDTTRHHILQRLARRFPTVWIELAGNWRDFARPSSPSFMRADAWSTPVPGLDVFTPGWSHSTFYKPQWLRRLTTRSRLRVARERLLSRGATRIVMYVWRDEFADEIELVAHDASCYHIDDEYSFSEIDQPTSDRELKLLRRVDQVIVHSDALYAKKGGVNRRTTRGDLWRSIRSASEGRCSSCSH